MSACILINLKADLNDSSAFLPDGLDISGREVQTAVDALMLLDLQNRMVEKCAAFLNQLGHVLSSISKYLPVLMPIV